MSRTVDPILKARFKEKYLLQEKPNAKQAMIDAGYSVNTAHNATSKKVVKDCRDEILDELKVSQVTPQWLLDEWRALKILAQDSKDYSTCNAIVMNLAKFVAQIAEKHDIQLSVEEKDELLVIRNSIIINITNKDSIPLTSSIPNINDSKRLQLI